MRDHDLKDGATLELREAVPEDAGALLAYVEAISGETSFLTFGPGEFELTDEQEAEFLRKALANELQLYLLGLVDGEIVGTLTFGARDRTRLRHVGEFGMSVRKAHWGRGIGSALVAELIRWARDGGIIRKINLRVRSDNERAIALYERHGFVREGTLRRDMRVDGVFFDNHCMGLEL